MSIQKLSISVVALILFSMISATAMGDDLEIYLGVAGSDVTYDPNVVFIMDTSGSMSEKDGGDESRMLRVQNALKQTLQSVTNINAGLMRFSDYGGPVLLPVRHIDDPVVPEIIVSVAESSDDAYEIGSIVDISSSSIKLSQSTDIVHAGLRYGDLDIPQGATITNAYLRFTSAQSNVSATTLTFSAELGPDPVTYAVLSNNISERSSTVANVVWSDDNDWPVGGETITSPDLSAVIQEVVNQATWCGGNAMNLLIKGLGTGVSSARQTKAFEDGTGASPQLVVLYDETTATGCIEGNLSYQVNSQKNNAEEKSSGYDSTGSELTFNSSSNAYIGMRFRNIALPKDATVTNAYLVFTAYTNKTTSGASFDISGSDEKDAKDFDPYVRYMLRDKTETASVRWTNIAPWYKNSTYQSPPVTTIVQQIVNRPDWTLGNDMVFVISNMVGSRGAYTYRGKPSGAPILVIEYRGDATPGASATVRNHLINKIDELGASGLTPIVDTLYEAANYYGGLNVDYGLARGVSSTSSTVRKNTRVSHRASYVGADSVLPAGCTDDNLSDAACIGETIASGAKYISPITDRQCQTNNHIVLLSDGVANYNHSVGKIEALLGESCTFDASGGEKCGLDLVENIANGENSVIDSRVITHTIGFAADTTASSFLNKLALQGGGGFYYAENTADLVTAFQSILKTVKDVNATFVSHGVAVNQLNRLTHKNELYFALFKPAEGTDWPGNVKKYKINGDQILDRNGALAVDSVSGFFTDSSHSYWSVLADGNDVREGGAISQLDLVRNLYTFNGTGAIATMGNTLHESNTSISTADLAIDGKPDPNDLRDTLLKWARGVDIKDNDGDGSVTDVRMQMGDPIHSQPAIVNYSDTESAIFVATNQGFLHSFDPETGEENFAVIPKELLSNLYDFYQNGSSFSHIYGLDGDMVIRNTGTKKYLYVGMRRGGRNYYVFDVTSKNSPSLAFKIEGGSGDFGKLGQTWSRPTITKINIGGSTKNVMIVGGGYDEDQDSKTVRSPDTLGNAVYIIDAEDGSLLWSASNAGETMNMADMKYSIPARISVIDRDSDGFADHMYIADTGGQLFRLDIHQGKSGTDLVSGGLMASLGGDSATENRRFYYGPDVSEISLAEEHYYAVALGSGYRAHPLNSEISDNFYMLKDFGVFNLDVDGNYGLPSATLVESDFYDTSAHLLTSTDAEQNLIERTAFAERSGWMITLGSGGEKVLASPLILDYKIFFTTYLPATASTSLCAPPTGNSRAYLVELVNGNAVSDMDGDGTYEHEDRYAQLKQTGIAPETKILIEDIVKPAVCLGTECTSAVIEMDEDGNEIPCTSDFDCLAKNIYGRFERVQKSSWKTETERQ